MIRSILCFVAVVCLVCTCVSFGYDVLVPVTVGPLPTPAQSCTLTVNSLPGSEIDCILVKYTDEKRGLEQSTRITRETKLRSVAYPDGFVPILVHKDKVQQVRDLLGSSSMVPMTEGLDNAR